MALTFEQAVKNYQTQYASGANKSLYEGLFPYLKNLGFNATRPTHAAGTLLSDDKIVDDATGSVYDVIGNVDAAGNGKWTWGQNGYWVDGKPSATPPAGAQLGTVLSDKGPIDQSTFRSSGRAPQQHNPPRAPGSNGRNGGLGGGTKSGGTVLGSPVDPNSNPYSAAAHAAQRMRQKQTGGRSSTILGGFAKGTPQTRPSVLGGY